MIESPHNEKLKLVRKLRERKHREREGLFVTEGEDLVEAGLGRRRRSALRAHRRRQRARWRGGRPRAAGGGLLAGFGNACDRGLATALGGAGRASLPLPARCRRPRQRRRDRAHRARAQRRHRGARARLRRPARAEGGAGEHGLDLRPADRQRAGWERRRRRGRHWSPTAARLLERSRRWRRSASAPSARGCLQRCSRDCDAEVTIPLRPGGAESLNVAAAAAIACERISSLAMSKAEPDA